MNTLTALGLVGILGFTANLVAMRLRVPTVSAFVLAGVLAGPHGLSIIDTPLLQHFAPVTHLILGFIALRVGRRMSIHRVRRAGAGAAAITSVQSLGTFGLVSLACALVLRDAGAGVLLGALAVTTGPDSTQMLLHQLRARGYVSDTLMWTVTLNDIAAVVMFGLAAAVITFTLAPAPWLLSLGASVLLGLVAGLTYRHVLSGYSGYGEAVTVLIGGTLVLTTMTLNGPLVPLAASLAAGTVLANSPITSMAFWHRLDEDLDFVYGLYFLYVGAAVQPGFILTMPLVVSTYMLTRAAGKHLGTWVGTRWSDLENTERQHLGLTLLPQGAMTLAMAALAEELVPTLKGVAIPLAVTSTVLFDLVGPLNTRLVLQRTGEAHEPDRGS